MTRHSPLNCARCDREVEAVDDDYVNSPYKATAFTTHGHYGSTIFDPMNGCYLEINLCDECIALLGERDQVLMGQDFKPVTTYANAVTGGDGFTMPSIVGRVPVKRELVSWRKGLEHEGAEDALFLEPDEILSDLYPEVEFQDGIVEAIKAVKEEQ
jgi:hypothetical protein